MCDTIESIALHENAIFEQRPSQLIQNFAVLAELSMRSDSPSWDQPQKILQVAIPKNEKGRERKEKVVELIVPRDSIGYERPPWLLNLDPLEKILREAPFEKALREIYVPEEWTDWVFLWIEQEVFAVEEWQGKIQPVDMGLLKRARAGKSELLVC